MGRARSGNIYAGSAQTFLFFKISVYSCKLFYFSKKLYVLKISL